MKNNFLYKHRFLILRRITQLTILGLYIGGNMYGWQIVQGNLSTSKLFGVIPLADPYAVLQLLVAGSMLAMDVIVGAILILLFYSLIGGRAFCSWVCPVNMITDLANWIRVKTGLHREEWQLRISRKTRYWILALGLILSFIFGTSAFELISPIGMTHRGLIFGMGFGWTIILAVFLFDLFVVKNGWCGHLCPLGAFYSLISKPSVIRVKYDLDKCTACMNCKNICPEKQVLWMITKESAVVKSGECINCGRCIEVCNDDALNFGFRFTPIKREEKGNDN